MVFKSPGDTSHSNNNDITDTFVQNGLSFNAHKHPSGHRPSSVPMTQYSSLGSPALQEQSSERIQPKRSPEQNPHLASTDLGQGAQHTFPVDLQRISEPASDPTMYAAEHEKKKNGLSEGMKVEGNAVPSPNTIEGTTNATTMPATGNTTTTTTSKYVPFQRLIISPKLNELYHSNRTGGTPTPDSSSSSSSSSRVPLVRVPSSQPSIHNYAEHIRSPPVEAQRRSQYINPLYSASDQQKRELFGYYDSRNASYLQFGGLDQYMPDHNSEPLEQQQQRRALPVSSSMSSSLESAAAAASAYGVHNERYGYPEADQYNTYPSSSMAQPRNGLQNLESNLGFSSSRSGYSDEFCAEPRERSGGPYQSGYRPSRSSSKRSRGPVRGVAALSGPSGSHAFSRTAAGNHGRALPNSLLLTNSVPFIPGINNDTTENYTTPQISQRPSANWYWGILPRDESGGYRVSQGDAIPIQLCEPPLRTCTPPNPQALKADQKKVPHKKSKYTPDQDAKILLLKKQNLSWREIARRAKIVKVVSARNRYQVLIGQQGGGGYTWEEGQAGELVKILDEAERAKWDFMARELSVSRGKPFTPEMCHYKISKMFAENPALFGVLRSREPFILNENTTPAKEDRPT